jgi:tRNA U34 5-methylaminomethyl-2-thiouridine-forming methyltransferase MnmC
MADDSPVSVQAVYELVTLTNGVRSVRDLRSGETFHPVIGPAAEAEALYVRQLRLRERLAECPEEFVLWDVGLGAGANVLTALRALSVISGALRVVSFDQTLDALRFAVENADALGYLGELGKLAAAVSSGQAHHQFTLGSLSVTWETVLGDFPRVLTERGRRLPAPHAIMYDAYSPMRNPDMWTLPLFERLHQRLDPQRPCALPTYSRSTILRVTLLLAGFFVGVGHATGEKEETTIAANTLELIDEPLDQRWLDRALRSHSAEPMFKPKWQVSPLSLQSRDRLRRHPQFAASHKSVRVP